MAKLYRVNAFVRINNTMISSLLRLGIKVWSFSLLTVRGRKSGKPIVTLIAIFVQDQKRYLIATYGVVNWGPSGFSLTTCDIARLPAIIASVTGNEDKRDE